MTQAAEFATHRPSYWHSVASDCCHDFLAFQAFVHGYVPNWHHEVIAERLLYGGQYELILGAPDIAKSTMGVGLIEFILGRTPNWRVLVASEIASGIATTIVTQIGETIAASERYQLIFGHLRDPRGHGEWSSHSLRLRTYYTLADARRLGERPSPPPPPWLLQPERTPPRIPPITPARGRRPGLAHPNVKAVGWRTGYQGVRAEMLMGDDLVSDRSSRSQVTTEAVHRTLHQKMLARLTGPHRRAILFGQRWAPRDLYGMLLEHAAVVFDNNPDRAGLHVLDRDGEAVA